VRQYKIPLHVYATQAPWPSRAPWFPANVADSAAQVKAIAIKKGITLISMESPGMWHQVGFLADAFQVFKQQGLSVDLVSTSETNVTVSLGSGGQYPGSGGAGSLECRARRAVPRGNTGALRLAEFVGHNIRGILHELGAAFELFQDHKIYLVTQAANDLNFTFVIDESQGDRLVHQLHERLIQSIGSDKVLGPTWQQLFASAKSTSPAIHWWEDSHKRRRLCEIASRESAAFVYDLGVLDAAIAQLKRVGSVDRWAYAMKANWHPEILRRVYAAGLSLECVSQGELEHAFASVSQTSRPSAYCSRPTLHRVASTNDGLERGVHVTLDNLYPLRGVAGLVPRQGNIHPHRSGLRSRTTTTMCARAGIHSKFGVPIAEADELVALAQSAGARVVGLHAHTGSGIFDVTNWTETGTLLAELAQRFPEVRDIDLGGGIGVPPGTVWDMPRSIWRPSIRVWRSLKRKFPSIQFGWNRDDSWSPKRACWLPW